MNYLHFQKAMRIEDYFRGLKIKADPEKCAFVTPEQQARRKTLIDAWYDDAAEIEARFGDAKILQANLYDYHQNAFMDLMIECLHENGWDV